MPHTAAPLPTVTTTVSATTATTPHPTSLPTPASNQPPTSIEAKLVILGAQGVGKTSLVSRFVHPHAPLPTSLQATVGASFVTKRIHDADSNTTVRLQIWDTAGQERFRSISRLYYRGANACLLCYDVTSERSWEEMKTWLKEMQENCDSTTAGNGGSSTGNMVVHIVGTKTDLVAADPDSRQVPFERTISYAVEHLSNTTSILPPSTSQSSTPPLTMRPTSAVLAHMQSPDSKRSSGFWTSDLGWDSCHEISAKDNDGIEEVFRVIARKLVEQRNKREAFEQSQTPGWPGIEGGGSQGRSGGSATDYFSRRGDGSDAPTTTGRGSYGSFRLGYGDRRKSWLGLPGMGADDNDNNFGSAAAAEGIPRFGSKDVQEAQKRGRCC